MDPKEFVCINFGKCLVFAATPSSNSKGAGTIEIFDKISRRKNRHLTMILQHQS